MEIEEIWKDVEGYEGYYQISSLGRVKSLSRPKFNNGTYFQTKYRILKVGNDNHGYPQAFFSSEGVPNKTVKVHRLVAKAFIPNPENKREVNHLNGIKTDNRVENLQWATPRENSLHAYRIGLKKAAKGENHHKCRLSEQDVIAIRCLRKRGVFLEQIAEIFEISISAVHAIAIGKAWKHIPSN